MLLTPAIPEDHRELLFFRKNGFLLLKRAEVLGMITRNRKTIAVAGTHGKTTVTTMIAWIMSHTKESCSAFLGGISKNFNSNLVLNTQSEWMVAEADEYDRSFLQLHPYAAVITAMDADHLDIYGNLEELHKSFALFHRTDQPRRISGHQERDCPFRDQDLTGAGSLPIPWMKKRIIMLRLSR